VKFSYPSSSKYQSILIGSVKRVLTFLLCCYEEVMRAHLDDCTECIHIRHLRVCPS
jgi:hypothetical protein